MTYLCLESSNESTWDCNLHILMSTHMKSRRVIYGAKHKENILATLKKNWGIIALQHCVSFCCTTEQGAELPVLYSRFPPAILHMVVYLYQTESPNLPHPSLTPMSACPVSPSAFIFLPGKQAHPYHVFRFHIYTLVYNICFSL